jgi:hypothetical protein
MIPAGRSASKGRLTALAVTIATAISLSGGIASAQTRISPVAARPGSADLADVASSADTARRREHRTLQPIRDSLRTIDHGPLTRPGVTGASAQTAPSGKKRSVARRVLGGAIGATAGFFAGGYLGAAIEGDGCHCDDPGLKGALIGAPVGAVTGGILGAMFF